MNKQTERVFETVALRSHIDCNGTQTTQNVITLGTFVHMNLLIVYVRLVIGSNGETEIYANKRSSEVTRDTKTLGFLSFRRTGDVTFEPFK